MKTTAVLVKSLFQRDSLDDCSIEELRAILRQYPYFTPVQLLLAEKLKSAGNPSYQEEVQNLSLHFNNPLWLDYLLNGYSEEQVSQNESTRTADEELSLSPKLQHIEPIKEEINLQPAVVDEAGDQQNNRANEFQAEEEKHAPTAAAEPGIEGQEKLSDDLPLPSPLANFMEEPAETRLSFEPYHTVDYFASQGIKYVPEEKPADRFGQQLKSFTEWLKAMKRLPKAEVLKVPEPATEAKVMQLADHSLSEGDVVTETMAEVWLKQNNKEKAIEIYNKLSLLNPDKSAYFASLAEQLKN